VFKTPETTSADVLPNIPKSDAVETIPNLNISTCICTSLPKLSLSAPIEPERSLLVPFDMVIRVLVIRKVWGNKVIPESHLLNNQFCQRSKVVNKIISKKCLIASSLSAEKELFSAADTIKKPCISERLSCAVKNTIGIVC
jgi:hypothetical protein